MANGHTFIIEEQAQQGDGTLVDVGTRFEWDAKHQSSPRNSWDFGIKQRTHREDYPGADQPTEQILGPNFTDFTLSGRWDDRYNYKGFAEDSRVEFEKLVQRGNYVRISFEGVSVVGIIKDVDFNYRREYDIGYKFAVSPHYRNKGGDARQQGDIAPQAISDPQTYADQAVALCQAARAIHDAAPIVLIAGTIAGSIKTSLETLIDRMNTTQTILDNRVFTVSESVNSVSRLVQSFVALQNSALVTLSFLGQTDSTVGLDYETAIGVLDFEVWQRELAFTMRQLLIVAYQASVDLGRLVTPQTQAIYRPHSGESLYGISNRFFGTPDHWRDIFDANNLSSFTLSGTELLIIPHAVG